MDAVSLTVRDADANNIVEAHDFSKPKKNAPDVTSRMALSAAVVTVPPNRWDSLKTVAESYDGAGIHRLKSAAESR
jgi:hypothetical protein